MNAEQARLLFIDHCKPGGSGTLQRYGTQAAVDAIMSLQPAPGVTLSAVLRVIDSCGGSKMPEDSDDFHAGYNAALDACEREMRRAWVRLSEENA